MARYIDADRLLKVLEKNFGHTGGADTLKQLIEIQPIAMVDKMADDTADNINDKVKAFDPHIIVNTRDVEPYYSILYYDIEDKEWHIGFGSYNLSFVRKWLKEEFEEVDVEFAEVKHGKWYRHNKKEHGDTCFYCSACEKMALSDCLEWELTKYCPHCGARMDGGSKE